MFSYVRGYGGLRVAPMDRVRKCALLLCRHCNDMTQGVGNIVESVNDKVHGRDTQTLTDAQTADERMNVACSNRKLEQCRKQKKRL